MCLGISQPVGGGHSLELRTSIFATGSGSQIQKNFAIKGTNSYSHPGIIQNASRQETKLLPRVSPVKRERTKQ